MMEVKSIEIETIDTCGIIVAQKENREVAKFACEKSEWFSYSS